MLMLAAEAPCQEPALDTSTVPHVAPVRPAGDINPHKLDAAIKYHRAESRRHAQAAKQHRAELRELLSQRDQHIAQLRASGWQLNRIACLYKVTKERVGQIVKGGEAR